MFNIDLSSIEGCNDGKIITRIAAKAIVFSDDKLLMIETSDGDLKLPGGGAKNNESLAETLKREVTEETGFIIKEIISQLGRVNEFKADQYEKDAFFEMISYYFLCVLSEGTAETNMDEYEAKLQMRPVWVSIENAIKQNNAVLNGKANFWVERELTVLKELEKLKAGIKWNI